MLATFELVNCTGKSGLVVAQLVSANVTSPHRQSSVVADAILAERACLHRRTGRMSCVINYRRQLKRRRQTKRRNVVNRMRKPRSDDGNAPPRRRLRIFGSWLQRWAQPIASIATAVTLVFTAVQANAAIQQNSAAQEQRVTETLGQAVEQLSSEKLAVRLLGIHALGQVLRDSPENRGAIAVGLSQFIRDQTFGQSPTPRPPEKDIQTALEVLTERTAPDVSVRIDLSDANLFQATLGSPNLAHAALYRTNLKEVNFQDADLGYAALHNANLTRATLYRANLAEAELYSANLAKASLTGANLAKAELSSANLAGAELYRANLAEAELQNANLTQVDFVNVNLFHAKLGGADLSGAVNLSQQQLDSTCVDAKTKLPMGLTRPRTPPPTCW